MNNETAPRNVSVIGLGLMGSALAEALLNAGHEVTVWNRTPAKAEPLTSKGASVAILGVRCCLCIRRDADLRHRARGNDGVAERHFSFRGWENTGPAQFDDT